MAAEFGFASLQKFGQEFLKKLHAKKMPNKLLERVSESVLDVEHNETRAHLEDEEDEDEKEDISRGLAVLGKLFGAA